MNQLLLLSPEEAALRRGNLQSLMRAKGLDAMLVCDNANLFYLSGRVFAGYAYIPAEGDAVWLVRRPVELTGSNVCYIHKPENIPDVLLSQGLAAPDVLGLEFDIASYSMVTRLMGVFDGSRFENANGILRAARSVKTAVELSMLRESGVKHVEVYRHIPALYEPGMTDHELQVGIERVSRIEGCLGVFRISGQSMELFMGSVLTGKNADEPTPYDFAMGGAGLSPTLPVGACGEEIKEHSTVMVDMSGNFTGYMTDMTRVFSVGEISDEARKAHQCSIEICRMFEKEALPGVEASTLYRMAEDIVAERGLERYFMGHRQHASFIGHGIGIEVNELPVIAPRSRAVLEVGNVIALEPKFVIPGTGAVGIENTYHITADGPECLTPAPEEIISLV